jgi:DNA-directed RNA polymerase specialized sigma24 family protein
VNGAQAPPDTQGWELIVGATMWRGQWDFSRLFTTWYPQAISFAMSICRDYYDAQDAVQSAFTTLMEKQPYLYISEAERAYLFRVIQRMVLRQTRSRHLPPALFYLPVGVLDEHPVEYEGWVAGLLAELPARQRQVLTLTAEGYKPAEIAGLLGIDPNAVRVNLHHARVKLQARLAMADSARTAA